MLLVFTSLFAWESTLLLHNSDQIHLKNQIEYVIMEAESYSKHMYSQNS